MTEDLDSTDLMIEIWSFNQNQQESLTKFNQKLMRVVKYRNYLWWCSRTFKQNESFRLFNTNLHLKTNHGLPKCIIKIVELVNQVSYFNKEIRKFVRASTWYKHIFMYYNRYYRYLQNERLFGKKKFLNYKHGHKLHFISYIRAREINGHRFNKNFRVF